MNQQKGTKINRVLQSLPRNSVATTKWLRSMGVDSDLLFRYKQSKWLKGIGHGAVIRTGDNVDWTGALYAIQNQLGLSVHPGGKTALALQGAAHYIPLGKERVNLYCRYKEHLPVWFTNNNWNSDILVHETNIFPSEYPNGLNRIKIGDFEIAVSSREQAIMEVLYCVPKKETLNEAKYLMEGLVALRPYVVQELLESCTSKKIKRLFMVLAELEQHSWLKKVDTSHVDFGKGNRVIIKGGAMNQKYQITVPKNWEQNEEYA